jgi:hypothetical protein
VDERNDYSVTCTVKLFVVVNVPSLAVTVIVVVPVTPLRGAMRIERLTLELSGKVMPEFNTTFWFDDVADITTLDPLVSASPTEKLSVVVVLRRIDVDDGRPTIVGALSIVIVWLPEVKPAALAVIVRTPLAESRNRKLAELDPLGIVTEVIVEPLVVVRNTPVAEVSVRFTTNEPDVIGVPLAVWRWIVMTPDTTPGVVIWTAVVNTNFGAATMVSTCVAEVAPVALAVIVGVPAALSR